MRPENINTVAHRWISEVLKSGYTVIDATLGNGKDTLFLAPLVKEVIAFDIQEEAISRSRDLLKDFSNIRYVHASHADMDEYVSHADLVVFNLGYLPDGDESVTTKTESTMIAIQKALDLVSIGQYVFVTFYTGHKEGMKEYQAFLDHGFENALIEDTYTYMDRRDPPVLVKLKKTE